MDLPTLRDQLTAAFPVLTWTVVDDADCVVGTRPSVPGLTVIASVDDHGFTAEAILVKRARVGWGPSPELAVRAAATRCLVLPFLQPPTPRTSPPAASAPFAPDPHRVSGGAVSGSGASPSVECPCDGSGPCRSCGGTGFVRPS